MSNLSDYFTTDTRRDGSSFVRCVDDAPEWLVDAVRAAHGEEMPNDWRFSTCAAIASALDERARDGAELYDEDMRAEVADSLTTIWTVERLAWLADDTGRVLSRVRLVDEYMTGYNWSAESGLVDAIGGAMCMEIERMVDVLADAWMEALEAEAA